MHPKLTEVLAFVSDTREREQGEVYTILFQLQAVLSEQKSANGQVQLASFALGPTNSVLQLPAFGYPFFIHRRDDVHRVQEILEQAGFQIDDILVGQ